MQYDIVIVGAGAAGLACAEVLKRSGLRILILEARCRPFGRVLTVRPSTLRTPIELGAEFIHGVPKELMDPAQNWNIPFLDVRDNHLVKDGSSFKDTPDYFDHLGQILPRSIVKHDQTIQDWLQSKSLSHKWKSTVQSFVEGFHAADIGRMGRNALFSATNEDDDELNGHSMFRLPFGYDLLLKTWLRHLDPHEIQFSQMVTKITWQKERVQITCRSGVNGQPELITSRKVCLTVPIGCLKQGSIAFEPRLHQFEKNLEFVEMGHVQRLIFQFQKRFWETLSANQALSFFHLTSGSPFQTWWTGSPLRTNCLTAWCGGPKAQQMARLPKDQIVTKALTSLSELTGESVRKLKQLLVSVYRHNWSQDPFSLGAYTYVCKDGHEASRQLSHPVEGSIYFAGEGYQTDSSRGTVHGALRSGRHAADLILKSMKPRTFHRRKSETTSLTPPLQA
jgi:monoamine oxidase